MVVVDSSVLIHLARIGRLALLREYFGTITVPGEVFREIAQEEKLAAKEFREAAWIRVKDIPIHKRYPFLEKGNMGLLELTEREKDTIMTNDKALIAVAKSMGLKSMWLTTFLLKIAKEGIVSKEEAKGILYDLVQSGMRLGVEVYSAIERELEKM